MTEPTTRTELPVTSVKEGGCGCGCSGDEGVPALDARLIPHALRHATIFGALEGLRAGQSMDLIAPHDPLPLLAQIRDREQDAITWTYLQEGPEAWTLRMTRKA